MDIFIGVIISDCLTRGDLFVILRNTGVLRLPGLQTYPAVAGKTCPAAI
jgi:hypothetical protein